jgi:hypothetical protein
VTSFKFPNVSSLLFKASFWIWTAMMPILMMPVDLKIIYTYALIHTIYI